MREVFAFQATRLCGRELEGVDQRGRRGLQTGTEAEEVSPLDHLPAGSRLHQEEGGAQACPVWRGVHPLPPHQELIGQSQVSGAGMDVEFLYPVFISCSMNFLLSGDGDRTNATRLTLTTLLQLNHLPSCSFFCPRC